MRQEQNFTQEHLAKEAEITARQLQLIESAAANVTADVIDQLAYALDVELSALLQPCDLKPRKNGRPRRRES